MSRLVLYQCTQSAVSSSTSVRRSSGPRRNGESARTASVGGASLDACPPSVLGSAPSTACGSRGPCVRVGLLWQSTTSTPRATPRPCAGRWLCLPLSSTGSDANESGATVAGFAVNPLIALAFPEINTSIAYLRDVLGEPTYESLARKGEAMTTAAMVTHAYDQIDQARAGLNVGWKSTGYEGLKTSCRCHPV